MRLAVFFAFLLLSLTPKLYATHVAGGELFYEYVGPGTTANTDVYRITMRIFRECNSTGAVLDGEVVNVGIYNNNGLTLFSNIVLQQQFTGAPPFIRNTPGANPCLTGNPNVCYQIGTYSSNVTLPRSPNGYLLSWIRLTRTPLQNVVGAFVGATFTTQIPGSNQLPAGSNNSSPQFVTKDTSIVCKQSNFTLDFSAVDRDGDSLVYRFANAYDAGTGNANSAPNPPPPPVLTLPSLTYVPPFSGLNPLGASVTINPRTGVISGIAPDPGKYVVSVFVEEYRNGILLNNHQKDFIMNVNDCSLTAVRLEPVYLNCTSNTITLTNLSTSSSIISYFWDSGDPNNPNRTSTNPTPTFTYTNPGTYTAKLRVTAAGGCQDSTTATVNIYPGFKADFKVEGTCINNPYQFTDLSTTGGNGVINSRSWNFGEPGITTDVSTLPNPTYLYPTSGIKQVVLTVTSDKGCSGSVTINNTVLDKPVIQLPFKDTLICSIDALQLNVVGEGTVQWSPNIQISNVNIRNPIVTPKDTITYKVRLENNGCINEDSIKVNVLDFISVFAGLDTAICKTDPITLNPVSDALSYEWSIVGNSSIISTNKRPLVTPLLNTSYIVKANLGLCEAKDTVLVKVFDYPTALINRDTTICSGRSVQLNGTITGTNFAWRPTAGMTNSNTLNPIVSPTQNTQYILSAFNVEGCTRVVEDTVLVRVVPPVVINVTRDTTVVIEQPLQFNATSNLDGITPPPTYTWTSTTSPNYLNNTSIANPIAIFPRGVTSMNYALNVRDINGCNATTNIKVTVFNTGADILVPTGFTPNSDALNNILRPFPVGIRQLTFFNVYNRFGQLIYTTSEVGKGWDGTFNGQKQPAGTYVFTAQGIDYLGNVLNKKGTVVLIR